MRIEESYRRQEQLEKFLYEMASSLLDEGALRTMASNLKSLYTDGFRHNYSRFFPLVIEVFDDDNQYNQDFLSTNLEQLRELVEKDYFEHDGKDSCLYIGLYKPLMKLADHINLEIGRYNHSLIREQKIKGLDTLTQSAQEQLKTTSTALGELNSAMQSAQREYVAILGIFAAVVLAFTGGIAFSTSVLENLHKASIYRLVLSVCIIGIVLFNTVCALFYFLCKIVRQKDYAPSIRFYIVNALLALVMIATVLAWKTGFVEKRNLSLNQESILSQVEQQGANSYSDSSAPIANG